VQISIVHQHSLQNEIAKARMVEITRPNQSQRLTQLDGLRGLAALLVFIEHAHNSFAGPDPVSFLRYTPLGPLLWGGATAVILFFVLSGLVLALPAMRAMPKPFASFYARFMTLRLFRIYPAFWFALLVSLVASTLYVPSNGGTLFWNTGPWEIPHREMLHYFLLIPNFHAALIDGPAWTLTVEMQMSLLMPTLIVAFRSADTRWGTLLLIALACGLGWRFLWLHYLPMFALGVALARHWERANILARRLSPVGFTALALVAFASFSMPQDPPIAVEWIVTLVMGVLLILAVQSTGLARFLDCGPVQFLGRISYSFYLLHMPIFLLLLSWLQPFVHSAVLVFLVALPVVCLASFGAFIWVERPAIRYSHRLVDWFHARSLRHA